MSLTGADSPVLPPKDTPEVAVVGAGLAGLAVLAELRRRGIGDVVVIDAHGRPGGQWLDRKEPGARSPYAVSESLLPGFPRAEDEVGPEAATLTAYLQRIGHELGLGPAMTGGSTMSDYAGAREPIGPGGRGARGSSDESSQRRIPLVQGRVTAANFDEADARWELMLEAPAGPVSLRPQFLVLATGRMGDPRIPEISGLEQFTGPVVHSLLWDPQVDPAGRRIVVLADSENDLTHVHLAPALAEAAAELTVLSARRPWVLPERPTWGAREMVAANERAERVVQRTRRLSRGVARLARGRTGGHLEPSTRRNLPAWRPQPMPWNRVLADTTATITHYLADPAERERHFATVPLTSGTVRTAAWFPAIVRETVRLRPTEAARIEPYSVVGRDGVRFPADLLVLATGAETLDPGAGIEGLQGTLGGLHLGAMGGQPNLFVTGGPASHVPVGGHALIHAARAELIARLIRAVRASGARRVSAQPAALQDWESTMSQHRKDQGVHPRTPWGMWPGMPLDLVDRLRQTRPEEFIFGG